MVGLHGKDRANRWQETLKGVPLKATSNVSAPETARSQQRPRSIQSVRDGVLLPKAVANEAAIDALADVARIAWNWEKCHGFRY